AFSCRVIVATLILADLHLSADTPAFNDAFLRLLNAAAGQIDALYLLGDIFEVWLGDDDPAPFPRSIISALHRFATSTPVYVMHGNRDFLLGPRFARESGATLLADPTLVELHGHRYLLSHGDLLCTDDIAYQRFRRTIRQPWRQWLLRHLPLALRQRIGQRLRQQSRTAKNDKPLYIMDASTDEVGRWLLEHAGSTLIHGHTHRPGHHRHVLTNGTLAERWVLPDWRPGQTGGLWIDQNGVHLAPDPLHDLQTHTGNQTR
ncbi:UDP-2,3-diacylglucosamine diphosphatase, partial [Laribacter hongkongensis]